MITRDQLNRAQSLVAELRSIENGLRELKAGANVNSLTLSGGRSQQRPSPPPPRPGEIPSPQASMPPQIMTGGFVILNNLEFPPQMLEGLADCLQSRLQQISDELSKMGIEHGSETKS